MKKKLLTGLAIMALTTGAYAGDCAGARCSQVKVTEVAATSWGTIAVATDGTETGLSCNPSGDKYLYVAAGAEGKNALYSALLTAKTTKTPINVYVKADSQNLCQITWIAMQ